MVTFSI